jgi:4-aminobutyrate aminotransferase-like enzyme
MENNLVRNSKQQGEVLLQGLEEIKASHATVGDARGLGLMCGVEFVKDKATQEPFPPELKVAERIMDACMERGLIIYPGHGTVEGAAGDHILIGPPLIITQSQVKDLLAILDDATIAVEKEIGF